MRYEVLVFLHVLGAAGVFAALAIEAVALRGLRSPPGARGATQWIGLFTLARRIGMISMITLLAAGIALMVTVWHRQPWISAAFLGIVIMAVLDVAVTRRRVRTLRASVAGGATLGGTNPALTTALVIRIAVAIGIVGLMTAKSDGAGSAQILAAAVLLGSVASIPAFRKARESEEPCTGSGAVTTR